ncbi:MAG TPA: hypothetical protein VHO69_00720, partial [Phototrophicaceae bacterium]|nr:hypothetical protein [Phototrophicaceae bacterium]
ADFISVAGDMFAKGSARANEGRKVVIGANRLIRMAYGGFVSTFGAHLKDRPFLFAADVNEARVLLAQT